MNFNFPKPTLYDLKDNVPTRLIQVANQLSSHRVFIPNVDKILQTVQEVNYAKVSNIEWIYCIYAKANWDKQHPQNSYITSSHIWKASVNNPWLQKQLLWRLALYYSGQQQKVLPKSLADSFDTLVNEPSVNQQLSVKIILALRSQEPGLEITKIACKQNLSYNGLKREIYNQIPTWIEALNFLKYVSCQFCNLSSPTAHQVNWLISCLDEMSIEVQVDAVNYLLIHINKETASQYPQLVDWLQLNYRNCTGWNLITEQAKQALREWIGSINYNDFQNLVSLILERRQLEGRAKEQLQKRKEFWANYSDRFEHIRILIPEDYFTAIGGRFRQGEDVHVLQKDSSDATEVCIFDFGSFLVVEFFHGRGSETRLIRKSDDVERKLFGSLPISLKSIRSIPAEAHDHVICWQWDCERWLRQNSILPNEGISYFKGLPERFGKYNPVTGLVTPSPDKQRERDFQLQGWRKIISQLEQEAKDYCKNI
ncbi:hypothetical protein DSM106972_013440 [Dulcicalothrix desertica PCC 7102]|uniref:Zorya protein ZorC EH domain-containing protein n=1 Tax=Dulcicalothrix desertica PCC 7102 TaxID=232991 RepID=A0A433VPY5_9CYAN|nr:EH signature domain-containing protein [Dulcicalothrix desertica]RUT08176.1 hypothetical protein DSM106972_013440 [Dulcicalothrix desertica PCC 7102]TWH40048.1 EH signature protein [Dulcicalothrix desertica PCC 7102]